MPAGKPRTWVVVVEGADGGEETSEVEGKLGLDDGWLKITGGNPPDILFGCGASRVISVEPKE